MTLEQGRVGMVDGRGDRYPQMGTPPVMNTELHLFLLALRYLTRLPVSRDLPSSDDLMIRATKYYPAVGLVVGCLSAAILWGTAQVVPTSVSVLVSMGLTMLITGAFHEDGLSKAVDALAGSTTRQGVLRLLQVRPASGKGVIAGFMVLAIKAACLMALPLWAATAGLVAGHALSRMGMVQVIAASSYAHLLDAKYRPPGITRGGYRGALAFSIIFAAVMLPVLGIGALASAVIMSFLLMSGFAQVFLRKLGGHTGECLGGCQQFAELGFYLGLVIWL